MCTHSEPIWLIGPFKKLVRVITLDLQDNDEEIMSIKTLSAVPWLYALTGAVMINTKSVLVITGLGRFFSSFCTYRVGQK